MLIPLKGEQFRVLKELQNTNPGRESCDESSQVSPYLPDLHRSLFFSQLIYKQIRKAHLKQAKGLQAKHVECNSEITTQRKLDREILFSLFVSYKKEDYTLSCKSVVTTFN